MKNTPPDPPKDPKPTQTTTPHSHRWDYFCPWCSRNIHDKIYKGLYDRWERDQAQQTLQTACPFCGNNIEANILLTPEFGLRRPATDTNTDPVEPPGYLDTYPTCPACGSEEIYHQGDLWDCALCGQQFGTPNRELYT